MSKNKGTPLTPLATCFSGTISGLVVSVKVLVDPDHDIGTF